MDLEKSIARYRRRGRLMFVSFVSLGPGLEILRTCRDSLVIYGVLSVVFLVLSYWCAHQCRLHHLEWSSVLRRDLKVGTAG